MNKKYAYLVIIFLIVACCAVFGRIAANNFINYDDNKYITENIHIQSGIHKESIKWALTTTYFSYWHPLTWLSHMLDWRLFGANAFGHHLVSLLFHIGAVILLFLFLYKTTNTLWPSAFAAAIFAFYPLRVESVAWAAERKDVLCMFFGMASIYAYAFYAEKHKVSSYALCLILFIMALMSKPMMVTLPFVLMLLDYWPLQRWQKEKTARIIGEKVPFIFFSIVLCIITYRAQVETVPSLNELPFFSRMANAIVACAAYLSKIFWPVNLSLFYPYNASMPMWKILISGVIVLSITILVFYYMKKMPFLFVGWFLYLGTLVPTSGIIQSGEQSMADRYTYMPSIGITICMIWCLLYLFKHEGIHKKILFPSGIAVLILFASLSWQQCGYWKNSITVFSHSLQVTKDNYVAHSNLASALAEENKFNEAIDHYNEAIRIAPYHAGDFKNRGNVYTNMGQYKAALEDFNQAIRLQPDCVDAYYGRGTIYGVAGFYQQAVESLSEAIRLKPDHIYAYYNRGLAYFMLGQNKQGCSDFKQVCKLGVCQAWDLAKKSGACF